uniref:Reverse transcriptase domain-containing protein n=2 Tax=Oreochromis TaxID=8139 RepID=A0A669EWZ3_ORENI
MGGREINSFLSPLNFPTLSKTQLDSLDAPISREEILRLIKNLPIDKAPGLDGFTEEFYRNFAEELSPLLLQMFEEALDKGSLPPTLSEALISLALKKNKDPLDCKSYRPISLINCDCKTI